ncbi:hypothetical protein BDN70DRAFT_874339 [Pholiota conissans]|uniref:N-acetyltransferase domain-containing protein n=1 Tax=Pholiota conissans TaxID=109636 RepID=A0A9P5ZBI0_9AGAR|nr:hypothetical protein BDN70DRAFT_874339 [Pholiota conissans]
MIHVGLLATEPASQGKGYGGALLEVINDFADERSKAMWLLSSNILNEPFYNSHGFETVGTFYVGEGNPEWTKKPIPVQIVSGQRCQVSNMIDSSSIDGQGTQEQVRKPNESACHKHQTLESGFPLVFPNLKV